MEKSLLQKALTRGLLSQAQLEECAIEKKKTGGQNLLDVLVKKGYLNTEQIIRLSQEETADSKEEEEPFLSSDRPKAAQADATKNTADKPAEVKSKPVQPATGSQRRTARLDLMPSVEEVSLQPQEKSHGTGLLTEDMKLTTPTNDAVVPDSVEVPPPPMEGQPEPKQEEPPQKRETPSESKRTPTSELAKRETPSESKRTPTSELAKREVSSESKRPPTSELAANWTVTPFGKTAILLRMATQAQVDAALAVQAQSPGKELGEILVEQGVLTPQQVKTIVSRQESRTLACPKCQKKYQIVMFQAGRSYQCKVCHIELVDTKKVKSKKEAGGVPQRLQVMGLTQEISMASLKDAKPARLDFVDEPAAPAQTQASSEPQQEIVTTEKILKQVGWELPAEIPDYTKRPRVQKQRIAPYVTGGLMLSGLLAVVFLIFFRDQPKPNPVPIDNKPTPAQRQTQREQEMHEQFQKLSARTAKDDDERELRREMEDWEEFVKEYVDNPHQPKAEQRIKEIKGVLEKINLRREWLGTSKKVNALLVEGMPPQANYAQAMALLDGFQLKTADFDIVASVRSFKEQVVVRSEESWQKIVARVNELERQSKFAEALDIIEKSKARYLDSQQPAIAAKTAAIKASQDECNWSKVAADLAYKVHPLLLTRQYAKASEQIMLCQSNYPVWNKQLSQWAADILNAQKTGEILQKILEEAKGKTLRFQLENGNQMDGKLVMVNFKKDSLVFEHGQNKVENAPFRKLAMDTFRNVLGENAWSAQETRVGLVIFLLPAKNFKNLKAILPELENDATRKQLFSFYLLPIIVSLITNGDIVPGEESMQEFATAFKDSAAFRWQREGLAEKLADCARKQRDAGKNKNFTKLAALIRQYLPDTQAASRLK